MRTNEMLTVQSIHDELMAEIEWLLRVCKDKTALLRDAYAGNERRDAEIERLRAVVAIITEDDKSSGKYQQGAYCAKECIMPKLRAALAQKAST